MWLIVKMFYEQYEDHKGNLKVFPTILAHPAVGRNPEWHQNLTYELCYRGHLHKLQKVIV